MKIIKLKKNVATIDRYTGGSSSGQSEKGFSILVGRFFTTEPPGKLKSMHYPPINDSLLL